ncbi:hypothetical protein A2U01_0000565, partial [Trifolium medium]|nr:hypothetical protein [Trifolium medium]
ESNFTQVLRIWDVLPPEDIPRVVKRLDSIFGRYTNDFISRCSEQCFEGKMEVPITWERSTKIIKIKNLDNNGNEDESASFDQRIYVENSKVEESFLLMKFYSLSSVVVSQLLSDRSSDELELPFEVSDEEHDLILFSRSTFVLGRFGTGKTTVLTMKLLLKKEELHHSALEHTYGIKSVEVSPKLCQAVKHQVVRMKSLKRAIKVTKGDANVAVTSRLSQTSVITMRKTSHLSHASRPSFKTTCRQQCFSNKKRMLIKRRPTFGPQIIVPYENDMHNPEISSLTIIEFPQNPTIRIDDDARFFIGDTALGSVIRGLVFLLGHTYHQVGNPVTQTLSNRSQLPLIEDPNASHFLGFDAFSNCYKVVRFRNIGGGAGTVIHCFTVGSDRNSNRNSDRDWRQVVALELIVSFDDWLPNEGVHTLVNHSSQLHLLCFERLSNGSKWEWILSFDCESERARRLSLPLVVGDPILCCLENKLCCAAFRAGFLGIHQLEANNSWIVLIDVYIGPPPIDPLSFLPISLQGDRLLLAFCGDSPADPDFVNQSHGVLLHVITGDVELIDTLRPMHWFSAMSFTKTLELLPYN